MINNHLYLFTAGKLPDRNLTLVIIRNTDFLMDYSSELINFYILVSLIIASVLSILLIFLLKKLTKPFERLNKTANEIAGGNYAIRVEVRSNDEIGEFARSFNQMAEAVSAHISALKLSNEEKERFVNNLTHELRTPLAIIKGYSELLCRANCTEAEKTLASEYIFEHVTRLEKLIQKLVDLLYLKRETLMPQIIDIEKMFKKIEGFVRESLNEKNIKIEAQIEENEIVGDEDLIQTLLINLVENGIKASNQNSRIVLKCCIPSTIEVTDFGIGIPVDEIEKVIEDFYRVDKSRSRQSGGIGLGLSICKQIMELHGGEMRIESVPGDFTTIKLIFTTNLQLDV